MAITSGTYTIGSGGDYATLNAFVADLGTQTGDITGRLISSSTVASNTFMSHDMGGFNLYLDADNDHGGDQTAAYVMTIAHNNNGINPASSVMSNEGMIEISGFRMNRTVAGSNTTKSLIAAFNFSQGDMNVHHMFIDGGGVAGNGIGDKNFATVTHQIWSNLIWDCGYDGIFRFDENGDLTTENCTIRNCNNGYLMEAGNGTDNVTNCAAFSNTIDDFSVINGTPIGKNNASTDDTADDWNTASGNLINLTEADEVLSTVDTSTDFMRPKSTGSINDGGTAPSITENTTDITGTPYSGTYPIGCYLEPSTGGITTNYYYQLLMAG